MMASHRPGAAAGVTLVFLLPSLGLGTAALAGTSGQAAAGGGQARAGTRCSAGARTLSRAGDHVYPDTGNGGYVSVHTDVRMIYDATANQFLPGNHVVLTDRATQCLTSFSLDFERRSTANRAAGPRMKVSAVLVNGRPARFGFARPAYPDDPNGPDDPNPAAHEASQLSHVGGPAHNPLPPACSPELKTTSFAKRNSQNGQQCPANKLVITPARPVRDGAAFTVTVFYSGRPGVHTDGDGTTEGWFVSDKPAGDGGFVTTEPVGTEDWMPLNDHPSAKPTYDFRDTVNAGRTVLANGILMSVRRHPPGAGFPGGEIDTDTLWHENMHQWWGDHVTEANYNLTFFKEGMATLGEFLFGARTAANAAGGLGTPAGRRAFQRSLVRQFNGVYKSKGKFWTGAPSNPTPYTLFDGNSTYERPGISYIALRQILGHRNFDRALRQIQRQYGGGHITEAQLEASFRRLLPNPSAACGARLGTFFGQWFDTAYPRGGGAHRPRITGPGLAGPNFYGKGGCTR